MRRRALGGGKRYVGRGIATLEETRQGVTRHDLPSRINDAPWLLRRLALAEGSESLLSVMATRYLDFDRTAGGYRFVQHRTLGLELGG
jgi:hypothetical protein